MNRFSISSIIKYLFIILIIGFFIILLLPEEKKTLKIEEKPESTVVEKTVKNKSPCAAKFPGGNPFIMLIKLPGYLKNEQKCRRLGSKFKSGIINSTKKKKEHSEKTWPRENKKERKINKEILTPKREVGINNDN